MEDDAFRSALLEKTDRLLILFEKSRHKSRLVRLAAFMVALAGFVATIFGAYQGYKLYDRYKFEKQFADYYKEVARGFFQRREYKRALDAAEEAGKLRPYDREVYFERVKAYAFLTALREEDLDPAEVQAKLLVDQDPTKAVAHELLGIIYTKRKKFSDAERSFKEAIRLSDSRDGAALYDLGKLYADEGRASSGSSPEESRQRESYLNKAIHTYQEVTKENSNYVFALYNIACDYTLLNQSDRAIQALDDALREGYGNYEEIAVDPDLDGIRSDNRFHKLIGDKYTHVAVRYEDRIDAGDSDAGTFHVLGWIQLFSGDQQKIAAGTKYISRAVQGDPHNATYIATLAELYAASGNCSKALENIDLAIRRDPSRPYYVELRKAWGKKRCAK